MQLSLTLTADLDLLRTKLMKRLAERKDKISILEDTKRELTLRTSTSKSRTEIERRKSEIISVEKAIELVSSGAEIENFKGETDQLLSDYKSIFPNMKVLSFEKCQPADQKIAREIITEFVTVAEKYYPLDVRYDFSVGDRVCSCGNRLTSGEDVCPRCQFAVEREPATLALDHKDSENEAKENFKRDFFRYQGILHSTIPLSLYENLDAYFLKNRIPIGKMVRAEFKLAEGENQIRKRVGKNENGTIIRTSVSMMIQALQDTGHSGYYSDVNYICQEYWGWKLPDLSALEDPIFNHDYDAVQVEYNKLMRSGNRDVRYPYFSKRKSNLSSRYRLFYHLRARGHICSEADFKLVKLPTLKMEYRKMLREIFERAGLPLPKDD